MDPNYFERGVGGGVLDNFLSSGMKFFSHHDIFIGGQ